jgi:hypothetical protein
MQHAFPIGDPAAAFRWEAEVSERLQAALPCPDAAHDGLQIITEAARGLDTGKEEAWRA